MNKFFSFTFQTESTKSEILEALKKDLPAFKWRGGDSDAQGPYISGRDAEGAQIKIWLGEYPFDATVSFRSSWDVPEKDFLKSEFISGFKKILGKFSVVT